MLLKSGSATKEDVVRVLYPQNAFLTVDSSLHALVGEAFDSDLGNVANTNQASNIEKWRVKRMILHE